MIATHSHYIAPVPPTYVTEYESAYQWPPKEFYRQHQPLAIPSAAAPAAKDATRALAAQWSNLEHGVDVLAQVALALARYCVVLYYGQCVMTKCYMCQEKAQTLGGDIRTLRDAVAHRRLDPAIEAAARNLESVVGREDEEPSVRAQASACLEAVKGLKGTGTTTLQSQVKQPK
jgi:hypothetical protein